jgi:hypothetical protein
MSQRWLPWVIPASLNQLTLCTVLHWAGVEVTPIGQATCRNAYPHRQVQGVLGWCSHGGVAAAAQQAAAAKHREASNHRNARTPQPAAAARAASA